MTKLKVVEFNQDGEDVSITEVEAWNVHNEDEKGIYVALASEDKGGTGIHITKSQLEEMGYIEG